MCIVWFGILNTEVTMIECHGLQWGSGRPLTPPLVLQLGAGSLTAGIGTNVWGKSILLK